MSGVKVNGVDLGSLRALIDDGYEVSSGTVSDLISIAEDEPALREELARANRHVTTLSAQLGSYQSVLRAISADVARIVAERMKKDKGDVNSVIDEIIRTHVIVMPQGEAH